MLLLSLDFIKNKIQLIVSDIYYIQGWSKSLWNKEQNCRN